MEDRGDDAAHSSQGLEPLRVGARDGQLRFPQLPHPYRPLPGSEAVHLGQEFPDGGRRLLDIQGGGSREKGPTEELPRSREGPVGGAHPFPQVQIEAAGKTAPQDVQRQPKRVAVFGVPARPLLPPGDHRLRTLLSGRVEQDPGLRVGRIGWRFPLSRTSRCPVAEEFLEDCRGAIRIQISAHHGLRATGQEMRLVEGRQIGGGNAWQRRLVPAPAIGMPVGKRRAANDAAEHRGRIGAGFLQVVEPERNDSFQLHVGECRIEEEIGGQIERRPQMLGKAREGNGHELRAGPRSDFGADPVGLGFKLAGGAVFRAATQHRRGETRQSSEPPGLVALPRGHHDRSDDLGKMVAGRHGQADAIPELASLGKRRLDVSPSSAAGSSRTVRLGPELRIPRRGRRGGGLPLAGSDGYGNDRRLAFRFRLSVEQFHPGAEQILAGGALQIFPADFPVADPVLR